MPFSGMSDVDIVRLAKIGVPADMMQGLLSELHGRVKKYADGGAVTADYSWITPQAAVQLLNRQRGSELPPGITDDILRGVVSGQNKGVAQRKANAIETFNSFLKAPFQPSEEDLRLNREYEASRPTQPSPMAARPSSLAAAPPPQMLPMAIDPPPPLPPELQARPPQISPLAAAAAPPVPKPRSAKKPTPKASVANPKPVQEAPKPPVDAPSDPLAPDTMAVPPMRPEESPMAAAAAATAEREGPPAWASPLMAAGFALMASKNPHLGQALGEAGLAGMGQFQRDEQGRRADRRDKRDDKRLDQQAELTREQIAAQKEYRADQIAQRAAEAEARGMDREEARKFAERKFALDERQFDLEKNKANAYIANLGKREQVQSPIELAYKAAGGDQQAAKALEFYRERPDAQARPVSEADILKQANELMGTPAGMNMTLPQAMLEVKRALGMALPTAPTGPSFPGIQIPGRP